MKIRSLTALIVAVAVIAISISAYYGHPFMMPHMRDSPQSASK